jgi:hypothetical protein
VILDDAQEKTIRRKENPIFFEAFCQNLNSCMTASPLPSFWGAYIVAPHWVEFHCLRGDLLLEQKVRTRSAIRLGPGRDKYFSWVSVVVIVEFGSICVMFCLYWINFEASPGVA